MGVIRTVTSWTRPLARTFLITMLPLIGAGLPATLAIAESTTSATVASDPLRGPLLDLRRPPRTMPLLAGSRTIASTCSPDAAARVAAANSRKSGIAALADSIVASIDIGDSIFHSGFEIFGSSCTGNANCSATGDECIGNTCTSGVCTATPVGSGTACSSGVCNGSGDCVQCVMNADCPGNGFFNGSGVCVQCLANADCPSTECSPGTCTAAGVCTQQNSTAGTTCSIGVCNGKGDCVQCLGDNDCPATGSECLLKQCTANTCLQNPAPIHTACGAAGDFCDGLGSCVQCLSPVDCPPTANECILPTCTSGTCGSFNAPYGTACGTPGEICDGTGMCINPGT